MTDQIDSQQNNRDSQNENRLIAERRAKLAAIRKQRQPFPNTFRRDSHAQELQDLLGGKSKE